MTAPYEVPERFVWPLRDPETGQWSGAPIDPVSGNPIKRVLGADQAEAITRMKQELLGDAESGATHAVLVGAEMGSGKTIVVTEAMLAVLASIQGQSAPNWRVLIVGPRDVGEQWFATIEAQSVGEISWDSGLLKPIDTTKEGEQNLTALMSGTVPGVYYVGLELLRSRGAEGRYKSMPELDLLITDEAHRHSNRASQGVKIMRTIPTARKVALSGTFFGNRFDNAHTVTRWLWPEARQENGYWVIDPSLSVWLHKWARVEVQVSKSGRVVRNPRNRMPISKVVGERKPGAFVQTLPCYVFLKSPVGDPPPPTRIVVRMSGEQRRQYKEMESQSLAWLVSETGTREPLVADLPIVQRIRLRTAALGEMSLVPAITDDGADSVDFAPGSRSNKLNALGKLLLDDPEWVGQRALILTHSKKFAEEVVRRIAKKYPGQVAQKSGDTKKQEWRDIKSRFMRPLTGEPTDLLYLVATHSAVGTGTDGLQFECSRVVWLSRSENNTDNMQSAQRIWRRGVDIEQYRAVEFVSEGSIDEEIEIRTDHHREQTLASIRGGQS